ncbi:hypothetical protein AB6A40_001472 [Gnathostoma spinigerum]|uniref:Secreted protein n=1 Tax=Gnathostoma spinigerum TaxID=75299 RepID=A0ABD6E4E6_9BILA
MRVFSVLLPSILLITQQESLGDTMGCMQLHGGMRIGKLTICHRGTNIITQKTLSSSVVTRSPTMSCDAFKAEHIIYRICLQYQYKQW